MPDLDDIAPDDTPEEQEGHQLPRTADDYQQAEWLAGAFAGGVRYDHTAKRWHIWDGIRWAPDKTNKITADVMDAAEKRLLMVALNANFSKEKRDHLEKVYRAMRNIGPVGRALETLASRPTYGTDGSDWDQNPNLLGCNNGIVDLRVNALMSDPGPDTLVTRTTGHDFVPFEYSERSGRPLWEQWRGRADRFIRFLEEITSGDQELATFFLQWFGYSLFGHTQEQRFLVLTGIGRNGKGVLVTTMRDVFGEYGAKVDPNMYVRTRFGAARSEGPRADLMALKGARMAAMSEPDGLEFNEELLKAHTGGDPITARTLHSPLMISWVPTHSITFLTNKPPKVEDVGPSMAARVMVADFNERFDGDREDKRLQASLAKEYEGILAILCFVARWWFASPAASGSSGPTTSPSTPT